MSTRRKVFCAFGAQWCGVLVLAVFLCLLFAFPKFARGEHAPMGICGMKGCNCTVAAHHWIIVKCVFAKDQTIELDEGSVPQDALEVEISHCKELRIQLGAFTGGPQLKRVHVTGIHSVVAKSEAFQNITAPNPLLEVSDCDWVVLESDAFKNVWSPLSVSISRCPNVAIKPNAFSWLLRITVTEVKKLELSSNAFQFKTPSHGRHGQATKIMFQSVIIPELPTAVFPSMAAEVRMDNLSLKTIRKNAFCAINIFKVSISNASIVNVEAGAFCDRTLINSLELVDVRLINVETGAFKFGMDDFTIRYSKLTEVKPGAIDVSAATVTFANNEFVNLRKNSIVLHQWNNIAIDYNRFERIEENAISPETDATEVRKFEFSFRDNRIVDPRPGSLKFAAISRKMDVPKIGSNHFSEHCSCNLEKWIREISGENDSVAWMMESSLCVVDDTLSNCFNMREGALPMGNFTRLICAEGNHIICEKPLPKPVPSASPPSVGPHVYPRHKSYFDVELSDPEQLEREKRIIVVICLAAVFFVVLVILVSGVLYMRRRGVCPKLTSGPLANLSSWLSPASGMTAATSARSISRLSVHEYAGLQPETRELNVEETRAPEATTEDDYAYTENKATQTLPEELTEEYLRDLRERLNDPDNYSQARDMIEHLYDLIKVEESCNNNNNNNNNNNASASPVQENVYDVIGPRARPRGPPRPSASIGTRVPSLEKLLPSAVAPRPAIAEYTEPKDNRTNEQNHLYAELPGDETVPSTSRLSQPVLATLAGRAPQPLPPDVIEGHEKSTNRKYETQTMLEAPKAEPPKGQARPLSFLKALGESLMGAARIANKRPNSLLCEYAEPSDATAHLYSELPEPQTTGSAGKMANRPLPTKPDQTLETTPMAKA